MRAVPSGRNRARRPRRGAERPATLRSEKSPRRAPESERAGHAPWARWLLLAPPLALTAVLTLAYLWNEDFWWVLSSGRYLLEHGLRFPTEDPFLYTSSRGGWVHHSWLWTVIVAALDRLGGLRAVTLLHAAVGGALVALAYGARRVDRWGLANALAATLVLLALGPRLSGKTEIVTWLLLAVFYRMLEREGEIGGRAVLLLAGLQLLWANLHGGYPLGPLVALVYAAGDRLEQRLRGDGPARRVPLWLPLVLLAVALADPRLFGERLALLSPTGQSSAVTPVGPSGEPLVTEWLSPFSSRVEGPWYAALWLLCVAVGLAGFARAPRARLARLLLLGAFAALAASALRHLGGLAVVTALVTVDNLADSAAAGPARATRPSRVAPGAAVALAVALLGAAAALLLGRAAFDGGQRMAGIVVRPAVVAPGAAEFAARAAPPGPLFNDYRTGAYLAHRLHPRQVFIDSRVIDSRMVRLYTDIVGSASRWRSAEERYGFRTAVLGNFSLTVRSGAGNALLRDPRWRLAYVDPLAVVFVRAERAVEPEVRIEPGTGAAPFVPPRGLGPVLGLAQRLFLRERSADHLVELLAVLGHVGRSEDAVRVATTAIDAGAGQPLVHRQRCAAYLSLGRAADAVADCELASRARPEDPEVATVHALSLAASGDVAAAAARVESALASSPGHPGLVRVRRQLRGRG